MSDFESHLAASREVLKGIDTQLANAREKVADLERQRATEQANHDRITAFLAFERKGA